ncbi:MAG: hypothetical protein ACYS9X_18020, partial [Planctomycetota bacterium]
DLGQEEEAGKEERDPEAKTETDTPVPPREVPESVMQHLRERAPELAEALPQGTEPVGPESPVNIAESGGQTEPEIAAPAETGVVPETVEAEVPAEPPAQPPPEPVVEEKKKPKKKTARKRKGAGKKRRTKRKKKAVKKSSKGRKKAGG